MDENAQACPTCATTLSDDGICLRCALSAAFQQEESPSTSKQFGSYELLEEIGQDGAMGIVYKARHLTSGRIVALKMLRIERLRSASLVQRFELEIKAAANLEHPNILPVYDVGQVDGRHYYTMLYASGLSLSQQLENGQWEIKEGNHKELQVKIARLVCSIAKGVHHAHEHGILHRDLKTGNVLLDEKGQAYIADFGLAKLLDEESDLTRTLTTLGTPSYMAPEQAEEGSKNVTARSDVWSIGVILYELLTGKLPFGGGHPLAILERVRNVDPPAPSRLNTWTDRDLEAICLKCLEKTPSHRFASAQSLASDLERWLQGRTITARHSGPIERLWKYAKRRPVLFGLSTALVLLGMSVAIGLPILVLRIDRARLHAEEQRANATLSLSASSLRASEQALNAGNPRLALTYSAEAARLNRQNSAAAARIVSLLSNYNWPLPRFLSNRGRVRTLDVSSDGRKIATGDINGILSIIDYQGSSPPVHLSFAQEVSAVKFDSSGTRICVVTGTNAQIVSTQSGDAIKSDIHHKDQISFVSFDGRGHRLLTHALDGTIKVWRLDSDSEPVEIEKQGSLTATFDLSGDRVYIGDSEGRISIVDSRTGKALSSDWIQEPKASIKTLDLDPTGHLLAAGSYGNDNRVRIWRSETGELLRTPFADSGLGHDGISAVRFSPDGTKLAVGAEISAELWNVVTGEKIATIPHNGVVTSVGFGLDGRILLSGSRDGTVRVWDISEKRFFCEDLLHGSPVIHVKFSKDARSIFTVSKDGKARMWDITPSSAVPTKLTHKGPTVRAEFNSDGTRLITASHDMTAAVWNLAGEKIGELRGHQHALQGAVFNPGGDQILTFSTDKSASLWSSQNGFERKNTFKHEDWVFAGLFSPDGKMFATVSADYSVAIWETGLPNHLFRRIELPVMPWSAQFSADGKLLLIAQWAPYAELYPVYETNSPSVRFNHLDVVNTAKFNSDCSKIVTASRDYTARVWSSKDGKALTPPLQHEGHVLFADFSEDGRFVLTTSRDKTVRIWDSSSGAQICEPLRHRGECLIAKFVADSRWVVTGSTDGSVKLWDAQSGLPITSLFNHSATVQWLDAAPHTRNIVTASLDSSAVILTLPPRVDLVPEWLIDLAFSVTGMEVNTRGVPIPNPEKHHLLDSVQSKVSDEVASNIPLASWAVWFLSDRHSRSLSDGTPTSVRDYALKIESNEETTKAVAASFPFLNKTKNSKQDIFPKPWIQTIDLTPWVNASLEQDWHNPSDLGNSLKGLSKGVQEFDGIPFHISGIIQLNSAGLESVRPGFFPEVVSSISLGTSCNRLYFLLATGWSSSDGTEVGSFDIQQRSGAKIRVPIYYGKHVRNWQFWPGMPPREATLARPVWHGPIPKFGDFPNTGARLYILNWDNPSPRTVIEKVDFRSSMDNAAPFLVGISAE